MHTFHRYILATLLCCGLVTHVTRTAPDEKFVKAKKAIEKLIDDEKAALLKQTPLIKAILQNNTDIVDSLIKKGVKLHSMRLSKVPVLFVAIKNNNADMARLIIQAGTNIDKIFEVELSPTEIVKIRALDYALLKENTALIDLLLKSQARILKPTRELAQQIDNKTIVQLFAEPKSAAYPPKPTQETLQRANETLKEIEDDIEETDKAIDETREALQKNQEALAKAVTSREGKLALIGLEQNINDLIEQMENLIRLHNNQNVVTDRIERIKEMLK